MDVEAMETFTSLLALMAITGAVLLVVARVLASRWTVAGDAGSVVAGAAWWLAWLIAAGATAGSLYFSEVADFVPCRLCWFQRVAMYPLSVILLIAALRRDRGARWYVLPIAAIGAAVSSYHYLLEWAPSLEGGACSATGPACADVWFREFGFVTLSFMALAGFVSIIVLLVVSSTFPVPTSPVATPTASRATSPTTSTTASPTASPTTSPTTPTPTPTPVPEDIS